MDQVNPGEALAAVWGGVPRVTGTAGTGFGVLEGAAMGYPTFSGILP